jgi:hypothetical protein
MELDMVLEMDSGCLPNSQHDRVDMQQLQSAIGIRSQLTAARVREPGMVLTFSIVIP